MHEERWQKKEALLSLLLALREDPSEDNDGATRQIRNALSSLACGRSIALAGAARIQYASTYSDGGFAVPEFWVRGLHVADARGAIPVSEVLAVALRAGLWNQEEYGEASRAGFEAALEFATTLVRALEAWERDSAPFQYDPMYAYRYVLRSLDTLRRFRRTGAPW